MKNNLAYFFKSILFSIEKSNITHSNLLPIVTYSKFIISVFIVKLTSLVYLSNFLKYFLKEFGFIFFRNPNIYFSRSQSVIYCDCCYKN